MLLSTLLLASDCATQAMYFGRYVEVGVEAPPVWRVASSCIDGSLPQTLHAIQGEQLIPIGDPGEQGLRSFGDRMKIAFQGEWRERVTGFILTASEQAPREFVRLDPVTQSKLPEIESLAASVAARGGAQVWRTKQNVLVQGTIRSQNPLPDDEPAPFRILAAGFDRFYFGFKGESGADQMRIAGAGLKWYQDDFFQGERQPVAPPLRQTFRLLHPTFWLGDWSALIHHVGPVLSEVDTEGSTTSRITGMVQHLGPVEFTFDRSRSSFQSARWKASDGLEFTQILWQGSQTVEGVRFPKTVVLKDSEKESDAICIDFQSVTFDVEIKGEPFALLREGESPPPEPDPFGEEGE